MADWKLARRSASRADDAGYLAMRDLARIAAEMDVDYRILGGHAVALLAAIHDVERIVTPRHTADADLGAEFEVATDPRLIEQLTAAGYHKAKGNHFTREEHGLHLAIDILIPARGDALETKKPAGDLVVDAIPGLGLALSRAGERIELHVTLTDGQTLEYTVVVPDVLAALVLKAYAFNGRVEKRDAHDVWRLAEAAHAAEVRPDSWPNRAPARDAQKVLREKFMPLGSPGSNALRGYGNAGARVRALLGEILGTSTP